MNTDQNLSMAFVVERQAAARKQIEVEHLIKQVKGPRPETGSNRRLASLPTLWKKAIRLSVLTLAEVGKN